MEDSMRKRLPDLMVEAGMIFLAVVLALAAEEWREKQDRRELAERALTAVVEEIRSNLDELERTAPQNVERLEAARAVLEDLEAGNDPADADIGLEVSLLSTAAWQSAQMSQAVHYFELDVMRQLSEAYEIQEMYDRMQTGLVDSMSELVRLAREDPEAALRQGLSGVGILVGFQETLSETYRQTLDRLATVADENRTG
jgi:hypothetical protein